MTTTHDDKAMEREQFAEEDRVHEITKAWEIEAGEDKFRDSEERLLSWDYFKAGWEKSRAALSPASGQEAELLAELDWCIENGNTGPRSHKALVAARSALAAPAQQVEAEKWISVTERRPEKGDTVIGYWKPFRDNPIMPSNFGTVTYAGPNEWHNPEDDEDTFTAPSHWMPLPKPPAAGSNNGESK